MLLLLRAPGHRKLVLAGEMGDAADVEDEQRMQRVFALHIEDVVVDEMNEPIAGGKRRNMARK